MDISKGQRSKLADMGIGNAPFSIVINLNTQGLTLDCACFGLDSGKRLSDDRYMVFFNQPTSPCGGVKLSSPGHFELDLARLPATIESLTFTLAIDGAGQMQQIGASTALLHQSGAEKVRYSFDGSHFSGERAVMLLEVYRKDGQWRLCAVGQGFNGGLDALVKHFGGSVTESAPQPAPVPPPAPSTPPQPKISLSKITLEKSGDKISLEKRSDSIGHGRIVCNLNWNTQGGAAQKTGFLSKLMGGNKGIDLDLGCLIEMADGSKGCVQALGNSFGSFDSVPYVHLAGDDRTGSSAQGEFLYINGDHLRELKRICVYAFIYEGVANWSQADGIVTVTVPGHPPIEVRLDNGENSKMMCAIAMIENDNGQLKVTKLGTYFKGHQELDRCYNWGMRWVAGSK